MKIIDASLVYRFYADAGWTREAVSELLYSKSVGCVIPRWLDRENDIYRLERELSAVVDAADADYYAVYDQKETFDPNMLANHSIVNPFLSNGF